MRPSPLFPLALAVLAVTMTLASGKADPVDVNSASVEELDKLPAVSEKLARAIVAFREEHGAFEEPKGVLEVPGMTVEVWEAIHERLRALPPLGATPLPTGKTDPGIIAIANYFIEFEGIDLSVLSLESRQAFLDTVNREKCDCGCKDDTMARCHVNDPGCEVARDRVRRIFDYVKEHDAKSGAKAP